MVAGIVYVVVGCEVVHGIGGMVLIYVLCTDLITASFSADTYAVIAAKAASVIYRFSFSCTVYYVCAYAKARTNPKTPSICCHFFPARFQCSDYVGLRLCQSRPVRSAALAMLSTHVNSFQACRLAMPCKSFVMSDLSYIHAV